MNQEFEILKYSKTKSLKSLIIARPRAWKRNEQKKQELEEETNKKTRHKPSGSKAQGRGLRIQEKILVVGWNLKRNCYGHDEKLGIWGKS